ncbi:MAG: hypothetical protein [Microviridae sp.]|nr:MAG: hypothetical protein [Microviridae sp.]
MVKKSDDSAPLGASNKPKFRTWYDFKLTPDLCEKGGGKSLTIPGESYTIQEILYKFARGVSPELSKVPIWTDPDDFDDIDEFRRPDYDLADTVEAKTQIELYKALRSKNKRLSDTTESNDSQATGNPDAPTSQQTKVEPAGKPEGE